MPVSNTCSDLKENPVSPNPPERPLKVQIIDSLCRYAGPVLVGLAASLCVAMPNFITLPRIFASIGLLALLVALKYVYLFYINPDEDAEKFPEMHPDRRRKLRLFEYAVTLLGVTAIFIILGLMSKSQGWF